MPSKKTPARSAIFGSIVGSAGNAYFNGLCRANDEFLKAIIRYSRFTEIHLFTHLQQVQTVKSSWADYLSRYGSDKTIRFLPVHDLHNYFSKVQYQVFHHGDPWIGQLCALRDAYCIEPFPITGRAHTLSTDSDLSKSRDLILSPLKPSDAILCSSKSQKTVMRRLLSSASSRISDSLGVALPYKGTLLDLPLGVEINGCSLEGRDGVREELGYQEDQFVILSLGRISPSDKMDLHPMLLVISELVESYGHRNVRWVVAGSGDAASVAIQSILSKAYELNIEDCIQFELSIDDQRKQKLLLASDVFLSLSDNVQESFGLAPLEAMAYGRVTVLSNWNGYSELVEDGVSGYLVDARSANIDHISRPAGVFSMDQAHLIQAQSTVVDTIQCASIIHQLIEHPGILSDIGEAGRQRVNALFAWESIVQQYHVQVELLGKQAVSVSNLSRRNVGFSYHGVFEHYPNQLLSNDSLLKTTERGIRVLLGAESLFFYEELSAYLNKESVKWAAQTCLEVQTLAELQHQSNGEKDVSLVLSWMLKYQLLEVVDKRAVTISLNQHRWWPEESKLSSGVASNLEVAELHRFHLLEPLLCWLDGIMTAYHGETENGKLRAELLKPIFHHLDKQLLQAIGWVAEAQSNYQYAEMLDHIDERGGIRYLSSEFPLWYRLNRLKIIHYLREVKTLFERLGKDVPAIKKCFVSDGGEMGRIQRIVIPERDGAELIAFLHFSCGLKLVYKNRDISMDQMIVGKVKQGTNVAALLNPLLGDAAIATLKMLPCQDAFHYGYCEFVQAGVGNVLNKTQAQKYYRQLGVISGLSLLLGLGDLHHRNVITSEGVPYIVDPKVAFSAEVLNAVLAEIDRPLSGSARGIGNYALGKTQLMCVLERFHNARYRHCSFKLENGEIRQADLMEHELVINNYLKVGNRHSLSMDKPLLCGEYADSFEKGLLTLFHAIEDRSKEWSKLIKYFDGVRTVYLPRMDRDMLAMQHYSLHTFVGFQKLSSVQVYDYFYHLCGRICRGGEAVQRWLDSVQREPVTVLAEHMARNVVSGEHNQFIRILGEPSVFSLMSRRKNNKLIADNYFSQDSIKLALEVSKKITSGSDEARKYRNLLSVVLKQWLMEEVVPGRNMPEAVKNQLPD
ncbi:glycosyltransferase [Endozoicomonas ascidiicola]|uniref:glycosyltransferase n=1 Tax=Endozoicomonas ascidiicola TaxID=1698521 RepID=UPI000835AD92|nr:glycosyltransferase [Endozoicomonas ascidiicola]